MPAVIIDVGGVPTPHYAAQLIVLGTPRPEGRPIDVRDLAQNPVVVRDPATQAVFVPITLSGEAAGLSQVFLTPVPEGLASCDGGPVSRWSTAQFSEMLEVANDAESSAAISRQRVEELVVINGQLVQNNAQLLAANAQLETRFTATEGRVNNALAEIRTYIESGAGGGGGGIDLSKLTVYADDQTGFLATTAGDVYLVDDGSTS